MGAAHLPVSHGDLVPDRHVQRVRESQRLVQPKRLLLQSQTCLVIALGRTREPQRFLGTRERES
jgi:hypothetical protein